ncbi:glycoside hydrolase family 13 protein [Macroventuria anomochaeta]|uniref:Glycoside hydrolase family 13 protein n=1 Tax=Macroventuria anomochaeta TaxID=301207 RepID=A0ACB6RIW7_9PLEO|nr:glycoside hydrolase family 13 protein [Macroventuria anomochaeta]KAF2621890.1 glycoside hydrolase family 13 protein [Macroventuria anomochaeta]
MGYDISDHCSIDTRYGTMHDIDNLLAGLRQGNMKLVMDLVRAWFKESRSSLDNDKRDWYIWRKPRYDVTGSRQPPNNWASIFGGMHRNLAMDENPAVVQEVEKVMRFWLGKGVVGFRMNVINLISTVLGLPDAPVTVQGQRCQPAYMHYACGPWLNEYLRRLRTILDEYNAFAIGEMPWAKNEEQVLNAVQAERKELNMIFQFDIPSGQFDRQDWGLTALKNIIDDLFLENHDQARLVSRFASNEPQHRAYPAKMLATFVALQSGTLFTYQGQELGFANVPKEWSSDTHAGFSTTTPWKRVNEDYPISNAQAQTTNSESIFSYWRGLLKLRKLKPHVFVYGNFESLGRSYPDVFCYRRARGQTRAVVVLNFSEKHMEWIIPEPLSAEDVQGATIAQRCTKNWD